MSTASRTPYLVGKAFRSFLFASVLTAAASQIGALIDGLMLSHFINEEAMSAVNISSPVIQTLFALCILIGTGGSVLAGMAIGNHRKSEASGIFSVVTVTAVGLGIVLGAAGMIFISPLLRLLCPDASLQDYTSQYLMVMLPGAAIYMLMVVTQMFVTLDGEPRRVTAAVTTCMVVNIVLDYIFIVWCGWAMTGAAVATVISYAAAIAVLMPHFLHKDALRFRLPRTVRQLGQIASMGLPFGIATVLIAVQLLGNNLVAINYIGAAGIVTLSICMYLLRFSMIILTGTLESFQPVAAILKGSGDNRGVVLVLGRAYKFLTVSLSVLALILIIFPGWIATLFGIADAPSLAMLHIALPAYAVNILLQCAVYLLIPVYQIYSHKNMALIISVGQPLLPMVCYWALSAAVAAGHSWVNPWWGFAIGQLIVVAILVPFALTRKGHHVPFILIPSDNPDELYDISITPSIDRMADALLDADRWMKRQHLPEELRLRIGLACEESVKNIIHHALGSKLRHSAIDMRIALSAYKVTVIIIDEGTPFNPTEQDPGTGLGLMLVRKTCDSQKYEYLFHQNILTIEWHR